MSRPVEVGDQQLIAALKDCDDHVVTTKEVAQSVSLSPAATRDRLDRLASNGKINKKEAGPVWYWYIGHPSDWESR